MVMVVAVRRRLKVFALAGAILCELRPASAQPVVDQLLSDAQLAVQKGCVLLKVNFNIRIRYASHFPIERGQELRITVNPIDRGQAAAAATFAREAATVPNSKAAAIKAIDLETRNPTGPALRILFDHAVAYQVAPGPDTHSIVVAIAGAKPSAACKPIFPAAVWTPPAPLRSSIGAVREPLPKRAPKIDQTARFQKRICEQSPPGWMKGGQR
jgi:hypothetical protein